MIEQNLFDLCEQTLKILQNLKEQNEITEDEFREHSKLKLDFIEDYYKENIKTSG